jgi:hypothetical protein
VQQPASALSAIGLNSSASPVQSLPVSPGLYELSDKKIFQSNVYKKIGQPLSKVDCFSDHFTFVGFKKERKKAC